MRYIAIACCAVSFPLLVVALSLYIEVYLAAIEGYIVHRACSAIFVSGRRFSAFMDDEIATLPSFVAPLVRSHLRQKPLRQVGLFDVSKISQSGAERHKYYLSNSSASLALLSPTLSERRAVFRRAGPLSGCTLVPDRHGWKGGLFVDWATAGMFDWMREEHEKVAETTVIADTSATDAELEAEHVAYLQREDASADAPFPLGNGPVETSDALRAMKVDEEALQASIGQLFTENDIFGRPKRTRAVLVSYQGKLIAEKYGRLYTQATPIHGWSMTKSVLNSLIGMRVHNSSLSINTKIHASEWHCEDSSKSDQRCALTINDFLHMSSGLEFQELYTPTTISDAIRMLLLEPSLGSFGASKDLSHPPGRFYYSSADSNILSRRYRDSFPDDMAYGHAISAFFQSIRAPSFTIERDATGTIIASSYGFATARDWLKFGLLYAQNGSFAGKQVLSPEWVKYTATVAQGAERGEYGAHFWLNDGGKLRQPLMPSVPRDAMFALGFEGQCLMIVPSQELVVLKMGLSSIDRGDGITGGLCETLFSGVIGAIGRKSSERR